MPELQNDLIDAWAENGALKAELAQHKTAIDVMCRSHVNWQELAFNVEDRLAAMSVAVRCYLDKQDSSSLTTLADTLTQVAQGPILPRQ